LDEDLKKNFFEDTEDVDPELAEEIKEIVFDFEKISSLYDWDVQRLMREIDCQELALALKLCSDEVRTKFLNNMSSRAAGMLEQDIEYMGPTSIKMIRESQMKIVKVLHHMIENNEILYPCTDIMVEDYSGKFIRTKTSIELEEVLNFLDDDIRKMKKTHLWMYHLRNTPSLLYNGYRVFPGGVVLTTHPHLCAEIMKG
jgi:hypothetical protein